MKIENKIGQVGMKLVTDKGKSKLEESKKYVSLTPIDKVATPPATKASIGLNPRDIC